jgi:hypothetical protein
MPPTASVPLRLPRGQRARRLLREAGILLATMLLMGAAASRLMRQDANWDLKNYHFYNAWAFVHGRLGWDLAPAQLQTFHNPILDLPFYWMVAADWPPRLISFFMVLPAAVGAFFLAKILRLLFREQPGSERWAYPLLAFLVGISASGPVSLLGSTMNEWPGTALVMIALWLLLRRTEQQDARWSALATAGVLVGVASGLKLTTATYAVGLCVALLVQAPILARGLRDAAAFGAATMAGVLLSSGAWMWTLQAHFGSPLFPYFNDIFRSPWWDATRMIYSRFGPHSLLGWLTFPMPLFGLSGGYVSESLVRDWRLPLIYLASIGALGAWILRRDRHDAPVPATIVDASGKWRFVLVFWGVSFVVWALMYSIYRYLVPLELLSGAVLVYLLALSVPRRWLSGAAAVTAALAILTVHYPGWGRIDYGGHYFTVAVPPVAPNAVVLLLADEPLSYVLPFFPSDGRFLGANNNINDPWRKNRLAEEVARIVLEHAGPLYSLTTPAGSGGAALDAHGLRRVSEGCASIVSNVSTVPLELCLLERTHPARQSMLDPTVREAPR